MEGVRPGSLALGHLGSQQGSTKHREGVGWAESQMSTGHPSRDWRGPAARPLPPTPIPDPCQAPAKSPRVTCASTEAGCGAPGLVRAPAEHRVMLSGRTAANVGSRGSGAKAAGSRRTQAERTRDAMPTPTQDALRRALRPSFLSEGRRGSTERRSRTLLAVAAPSGSWRHCCLRARGPAIQGQRQKAASVGTSFLRSFPKY